MGSCLSTLLEVSNWESRPDGLMPGVQAPRYDFGVPFLLRNSVNKSIGIGRKVVVSCSLEISRKVFSTRGGIVR
jgi:hypothetical protein